jgi:phage-related protein
MPHSKAMPSVAKGCFELRVRCEDGVYRVFYCIKLKEQILVLHAFKKKTQKTAFKDILQARQNLKELL